MIKNILYYLSVFIIVVGALFMIAGLGGMFLHGDEMSKHKVLHEEYEKGRDAYRQIVNNYGICMIGYGIVFVGCILMGGSAFISSSRKRNIASP